MLERYVGVEDDSEPNGQLKVALLPLLVQGRRFLERASGSKGRTQKINSFIWSTQYYLETKMIRNHHL